MSPVPGPGDLQQPPAWGRPASQPRGPPRRGPLRPTTLRTGYVVPLRLPALPASCRRSRASHRRAEPLAATLCPGDPPTWTGSIRPAADPWERLMHPKPPGCIGCIDTRCNIVAAAERGWCHCRSTTVSSASSGSSHPSPESPIPSTPTTTRSVEWLPLLHLMQLRPLVAGWRRCACSGAVVGRAVRRPRRRRGRPG